MNIFVVGSPWHAVVACALAESKGVSDPIFIVEKISEKSYEQILNVLSNRKIFAVFSHDETRFVSIKKIGVIKFISRMKRGFETIARSALALKACIGSEQVEHSSIYYFNFYSPITRQFLKEFKSTPNVEFIRVEDGICDYFPFNFMNYSLIQRIGKASLAITLGKYSLYRRSCAWLFNRTSLYCVFFPEKIEGKWRSKELLSLLGEKDWINNLCASEASVNEVDIGDASASLLLLGQTLYEDGICSLEAELDAYASLLNLFEGKKYYKPHPRTCEEKLMRVVSMGFTLLDVQYSAEYLISKYKFKALVGMWSNTIIYSRQLFSTPSYSLAGFLAGSAATNSVQKIRAILNKKFPEDYRELESNGC